MPDAWLTIDDGPSEKFHDLVDFLSLRGTPAIFFNRGDHMEMRLNDVLYGIEKGFVMGNHAWSHRRASLLSFEEVCDEILRTEALLETLYRKAGVKRKGRYFRFPYMDRGMGGWLAEPESLHSEHRAGHDRLARSGLGHVLSLPSQELIYKKRLLQDFLRQNGFEGPPARKITIPWYAQSEMVAATDWLCTFSTSDWALGARHKDRHGFLDLEDLKRNIHKDPWLHDPGSGHIILIHDQTEIHDVTKTLIDDFLEKDFVFQNILKK